MVAIELLRPLLREHLANPFPESVEKGRDYGSVDPVMIDADIYGWVMRAAEAGSLRVEDRNGLRDARTDLTDSLLALPLDARPYFERLVAMATLALDDHP